jgi:hypothetical protein
VLAELANDDRMEESAFGIPAHIHVCATTDGSVLLDLKRNRYFGLGREETELLAAVLPEWPTPGWDCAPLRMARDSEESKRAVSLCESLASNGLLVRSTKSRSRSTDRHGTNNRRMRHGAAMLGDMRGEWISIGDELEVRGRIGLGDIVNFLWAYMWVRGSLLLRPIAATVESMRALKAGAATNCASWQIHRVAALVDAFRRLRPLVFAAEGHCLLHALTLVKFLSRYDFHPEWMIGVTTQPWGAHSWVQWKNYLLDTSPEKVCGYVPIMAV